MNDTTEIPRWPGLIRCKSAMAEIEQYSEL